MSVVVSGGGISGSGSISGGISDGVSGGVSGGSSGGVSGSNSDGDSGDVTVVTMVTVVTVATVVTEMTEMTMVTVIVFQKVYTPLPLMWSQGGEYNTAGPLRRRGTDMDQQRFWTPTFVSGERMPSTKRDE